MVEHFGAPALFLTAIAAFFGRLVALARQLADALLALAQFAAAIAVGFVLAGGRPVRDLTDGFDRRGHHRLYRADAAGEQGRSEEHTPELQSLMRISYAVFCLKKKMILNIPFYSFTCILT